MIIDLSRNQHSHNCVVNCSLSSPATIIQGDADDLLRILPDKCIQCVITSPPYWGIRDYRVDGQIGMESSLDDYLSRLLSVFHEIKRVLKDDGVMWINIGDVYASGNRKYRAPDTKYPQRALQTRPPTPFGLKSKDLIGIPWRVAFALQREGWYLRTDIIWNKANAMPESVKDRPSRCHEYLFLLTKSKQYFFSRSELEKAPSIACRSVWTISTTKSKFDGHNAVFPEKLVFPCIYSSTIKKDLVLDPFCGTGTVGHVCTMSGRRFVGIELNPQFAQIAVKRLGENTNLLKASS